MKKLIIITWILALLSLGVIFLMHSQWSIPEETKEPQDYEVILDPMEMSQSDSISARQYRRMDSLHAAGKL